MAFNPYTGGQAGMPAPVIPDRGGVPPVMGGNKGASRRSASGNNVKGVSRRKSGKSIPKMSPAPAITSPQPAPMPQNALPSQSDPFNLDWAMARNMGNGGYRNGGY
jgi:hypothetical protein